MSDRLKERRDIRRELVLPAKIDGALVRGVLSHATGVLGSEMAGEVVAAMVRQMGRDEQEVNGGRRRRITANRLTQEEAATRRDALLAVAGALGITLAVESLYNRPAAPIRGRLIEWPEAASFGNVDVESAAAQAAILSSLDGGEVWVHIPGGDTMTGIRNGSASIEGALQNIQGV